MFCNNDDGKQISKTEFYRMWWDFIGKVPIEGLEERKITTYSLRHTCITFRLYSGVSHYEVAKDARTSVRYIEEHYEHFDAKKLMSNVRGLLPVLLLKRLLRIRRRCEAKGFHWRMLEFRSGNGCGWSGDI